MDLGRNWRAQRKLMLLQKDCANTMQNQQHRIETGKLNLWDSNTICSAHYITFMYSLTDDKFSIMITVTWSAIGSQLKQIECMSRINKQMCKVILSQYIDLTF